MVHCSCGLSMVAIQYHADTIVDAKGRVHPVKPSTCLVCPKCDGPVGDAAPRP